MNNTTDALMQTGLMVGSSMFGANAATAAGEFSGAQYQMQAEEANLAGVQASINSTDKTLRAVASIRAAGAASGIAEGGGSITNAILQAQRQGQTEIINSRDQARVLARGRTAAASESVAAGKAKATGILADAGNKMLSSGVLNPIVKVGGSILDSVGKKVFG